MIFPAQNREAATLAAPEPNMTHLEIVSARGLDAATLHARYLDDVFRYALRRIGRREDAEDIAAETFAAAFQGLNQWRGQNQIEPRAWLLGIARRKVADALRRQGRKRETLQNDDFWHHEIEPAPEPALLLARRERHQALRRVLLQLKEEQREVLLLKYVEELSLVEISVVMRRSPAAINSLLQRARASAFRAGCAYFLDHGDEVISQ